MNISANCSKKRVDTKLRRRRDMPARSSSKGAPAEKTLVITRVFDAPRDRVWNAWTDPAQMAKWWGPHGFTNPVFQMDVRPGGAILIHMKNPYNNSELPVTGAFVEVVKPQKLVFTHSVYGNENLNTVTFTEQNGKTTMRMEMVFTRLTSDPAQALAGARSGLDQSLDRLASLLSEST
jgi:uncharacterized protein YndB with AHSA1/START domain